MLKALKWLVIIVVGAFIALFALGMVVEANKSPEEKAADEAARRAAQAEKAAAAAKLDEPNQEDAAEETPFEKVSEQSEPTPPPEQEMREQDQSEGRVKGLVDKVKSIAADAEWHFTSRESPFDGSIYQASKAFESEEYTAEIIVQVRCVQAKKDLSLVFLSHVYDSDGNTLPSSAFGNTWDISGQPFATQGRVKFLV